MKGVAAFSYIFFNSEQSLLDIHLELQNAEYVLDIHDKDNALQFVLMHHNVRSKFDENLLDVLKNHLNASPYWTELADTLFGGKHPLVTEAQIELYVYAYNAFIEPFLLSNSVLPIKFSNYELFNGTILYRLQDKLVLSREWDGMRVFLHVVGL